MLSVKLFWRGQNITSVTFFSLSISQHFLHFLALYNFSRFLPPLLSSPPAPSLPIVSIPSPSHHYHLHSTLSTHVLFLTSRVFLFPPGSFYEYILSTPFPSPSPWSFPLTPSSQHAFLALLPIACIRPPHRFPVPLTACVYHPCPFAPVSLANANKRKVLGWGGPFFPFPSIVP